MILCHFEQKLIQNWAQKNFWVLIKVPKLKKKVNSFNTSKTGTNEWTSKHCNAVIFIDHFTLVNEHKIEESKILMLLTVSVKTYKKYPSVFQKHTLLYLKEDSLVLVSSKYLKIRKCLFYFAKD